MSGHHLAKYGHQRSLSRGHSKDFTVATPEEFVKRFGGDRVINKVPATLSKVQYVFCQSRCLSVWHLYIVTIALSCIISHIQPDIGRKSQNLYTPPVFGILRRCLQWWGYHMREKVWWYVKLFRYNMGAWQTDGIAVPCEYWTLAFLCWCAIKVIGFTFNQRNHCTCGVCCAWHRLLKRSVTMSVSSLELLLTQSWAWSVRFRWSAARAVMQH